MSYSTTKTILCSIERKKYERMNFCFFSMLIKFTKVRSITMKKNESKLDRIIRVFVGIISVAVGIILFFTLGSPLNLILLIVLAVIGGIALFTAATGFCVLYALFKISTNKSE